MTEKPSRNEDEYFAKEDAERIRRLRAQQEAEQQAAERKSHYMKCPKCGADLVTVEFHEVQIDRCGDCHGIWLDNGEVELLMKHEDPGLFKRVMGDIASTLRLRTGK